MSAGELLAEQFRQQNSMLRKVVSKKAGGDSHVFQPMAVAQDWSLERSLDKLYTGYGDIGYLASEQLAHEPVLKELVENFLIFLLDKIALEDVTSRNWGKIGEKVKEAMHVVLVPNLAPYHYTFSKTGGAASFSSQLATMSPGNQQQVKNINHLIKDGLLHRLQESSTRMDF